MGSCSFTAPGPESPDGLPLSSTEPFYTGDNMTVAWDMTTTEPINLILVQQFSWNDSDATSVNLLINSDETTADWRVGSSDLNYTETSVGPIYYWHVASQSGPSFNCSSEHFRIQNRTTGATPAGTSTGTITSTSTSTSTRTSLSAGAIVGITLGAVVTVLALLALLTFIFRKRLAPLLPCLMGRRKAGSERLDDDELTEIGSGGGSSTTQAPASPAAVTAHKRSIDSTSSYDTYRQSPGSPQQPQQQQQQQQQRRTVHQLPPACLPPHSIFNRHELASSDVPVELESGGDVEALPSNMPISLYSSEHVSSRPSTITEFYRNHI